MLSINKKELVCFFPDYTRHGWNILHNKNQLSKLNGKKISVVLKLFPLDDKDVKFSDSQTKKLALSAPDAIYEAEGKLFEKVLGKKDMFVFDCGIGIHLQTPKNKKFKVEDWVKAVGRLDAYLID